MIEDCLKKSNFPILIGRGGGNTQAYCIEHIRDRGISFIEPISIRPDARTIYTIQVPAIGKIRFWAEHIIDSDFKTLELIYLVNDKYHDDEIVLEDDIKLFMISNPSIEKIDEHNGLLLFEASGVMCRWNT